MSAVQDTFFPTKPSNLGFPKWSWEADYKVITHRNVADALREVVASETVAWDSEYDPTTTGHRVSAFSFSTKPSTGWLLPVGMYHMPNMSFAVAQRFLQAIARKRNVCQNSRAEMRSVMHSFPDHPNIELLLRITDDIQIEWYHMDPNEAKDFKEAAPKRRGAGIPQGFSQHAMALKYLKLETPDLGEYFRKGGSFADLDPEIARVYACSDADVCLRLHNKAMSPTLQESFSYKLDMALLPVLLDMEETGFRFDQEELEPIEIRVRQHVAELREAAYVALQADASINIDSHEQLAKHLQNTLNWPNLTGKKTQKGLPSVDKMHMERWSEHPDPAISKGAAAFQTYKKWFTLHNNFISKLGGYVNPKTGAIHCSLINTVVPTGRLACAGPNLQQVPKNKEAPVRKAFKARPGYFLLSADYSQIELRVYAGESQEGYFLDSFITGEDHHLKTASIIYREPITEKSDPRRQVGKTMNFGPIYGMTANGLSMRTDYTLDEAQAILDDFFANIPAATKWTEQQIAISKQKGGVHTKFGFWRPLPWLASRNPKDVAFGERSAINTIVQGTAAQIMKIGLIRLWKALKRSEFDAHIILTIHDSAMLEVRDGTPLEPLMDLVEEAMCFEIKGYPPITVDFEWGYNWFEMNEIKRGEEIKPTTTTFKKPVKELALPLMSPEQNERFITVVREVTANGAGNLELRMRGPDGFEFTPLSVNDIGYKKLLLTLIAISKEPRPQVEGGENVPAVSFV